MKLVLTALLIILVMVLLPGCALSDEEAPVTTEFARMLAFVPYSFLEEHDIWFGDPGTIKRVHGLEDLTSLETMEQMPVEERREAMSKIGAVPVPHFTNNYFQIAPLIGWDGFMIARAIFHEVPPPWGFSVIEGDFDEDLIAAKLTEQGYEKAEYGPYTYYWKNEDMQIDIMSDIGRQVLAQLNRVAILDDALVVAPATDIMTGVLDAMAGNVSTIIDNPDGRAVADSLNDVLGAVLITPERVFQITPATEIPVFDLPAAANWGALHEYSLLGMGYKDDGKERYWIISLYYDDKEAAASDADELVSRLESYVFNTHIKQMETIPLTSKYEVGKSVVIVRENADGAVLRIVCRYLPETTGSSSIFNLVVPTRDFLFLAADPSLYIAK